MDNQEICRRYPLLVKALQYVLIGSIGEACCTIRMYKQGIEYGCEAVSHAGGTNKQAIERAIRASKTGLRTFPTWSRHEFRSEGFFFPTMRTDQNIPTI